LGIGLIVALLVFTLARRILFIGDEIALFSLVFNGLRDLLGPTSFTAGCAMIGIVALGSVTLIILITLNTLTCFSADPTEFCRAFPGLVR
jgi:hypothetical protein